MAVLLAADSLVLSTCPGVGSASSCLILGSVLSEATCTGSSYQGLVAPVPGEAIFLFLSCSCRSCCLYSHAFGSQSSHSCFSILHQVPKTPLVRWGHLRTISALSQLFAEKRSRGCDFTWDCISLPPGSLCLFRMSLCIFRVVCMTMTHPMLISSCDAGLDGAHVISFHPIALQKVNKKF